MERGEDRVVPEEHDDLIFQSSSAITDPSITSPQPEPAWRLAPGQTLRRHQWQGEAVLYNDLSGDTHLLDEAAIHVLLALQAGPATRRALAAGVRAEFAGDDGEVDDAALDELLAGLRSLVLIEAA